MNATMTVGIAPDTLVRLIRYFEERENSVELNAAGTGGVDLTAAVTGIVEAWLADRQRAAAFAEEHDMQSDELPRGYHWKELFLPHGTRVRLYLNGPGDHATVVGDRLMFDGDPVSPNQFVGRFRHVPCNAWEYLAVLFPGEKKWVRAKHLRRSHAGPRDRRSGQRTARQPATR